MTNQSEQASPHEPESNTLEINQLLPPGIKLTAEMQKKLNTLPPKIISQILESIKPLLDTLRKGTMSVDRFGGIAIEKILKEGLNAFTLPPR